VPCIFCIAVFLIAASVVTAATVDELEERLEGATSEPVERAADTDSVTLWNATFEVAGKAAPVAITVYKRWGRARIQVLTHELSREQVEELEDRIAELLGLRVVSRSDEKDEEPVRQAQEAEAAARAEEAQPGEAAPVERPEAGRVPMPPPPPKG
jgi:hypothetical protein